LVQGRDGDNTIFANREISSAHHCVLHNSLTIQLNNLFRIKKEEKFD
jgi:hypothetical protein